MEAKFYVYHINDGNCIILFQTFTFLIQMIKQTSSVSFIYLFVYMYILGITFSKSVDKVIENYVGNDAKYL